MKVNEAQNQNGVTELSPRPAQHTEGPWLVSRDGVTIYGALNPKTGGYPHVGKAENPVSISLGVKEHAEGQREQIANAGLMAKGYLVPQLLAALKVAEDVIESRATEYGNELNKIKEAIAAADGDVPTV